MEEFYKLLYIRCKCKKLSLTNSQISTQEDVFPITQWVEEIKDGMPEEVTYEVTAGTSQVHIGQKDIHELMETWVETDSEKILTSPFVKTI